MGTAKLIDVGEAGRSVPTQRRPGRVLVIPAPVYSLVQAAWIPRLVVWRDDDTFMRREGEPCENWAAAMTASWKLVPRPGGEKSRTGPSRLTRTQNVYGRQTLYSRLGR